MTAKSGNKVAIVTTTLYKDPYGEDAVRYHLACQMLGDAIQQGHKTFVVDGSPDDNTLRHSFLASGARIVKEKGRGMGASRRQAFSLALDSQGYAAAMTVGVSRFSWVLWTEAEKADMIRSIPAMVMYAEAEGLDILVPERDPQIMESTYPPFQVVSEREGNELFCNRTGHRLDIFGGPILARAEMLPLFASCNPQELWGVEDKYIQMPPVMQAIAQGKKVGSLRVPFCYPSSQLLEETTTASEQMRDHRKRQLDGITNVFQVVAKALNLPKAV